MADKKISALTGASTPLAGSEVLPIVQGGATVKVSVDNLTAGKTVNASGLQIGNIGATSAAFPGRIKLEDGPISLQGPGGLEFVTATFGSGYGWKISSIDSAGVQLVFGTRQNSVDWTEAMRLTSDGNLKISIAGKGIDFSANTHAAGMTSELLNDYEEGTWTPTDASGAGLTFTVNFARYTKVGNLVTANGFITFPSTANASAITISLPYLAANSVVGSAGSDSTSNAVNILTAGGAAQFTVRNNQLTPLTNANLSGLFLFFSVTYQV